ncbi:MAG: chaperone modulator CbpM [Pseudomonadota bacterium]
MNPMDKKAAAALILEEQADLTLGEVARACGADQTFIVALVDEGALFPGGSAPAHWHFTGSHVHRIRVALRLQEDLGVNLAGAALALELLDELQDLRQRLKLLEGHTRLGA